MDLVRACALAFLSAILVSGFLAGCASTPPATATTPTATGASDRLVPPLPPTPATKAPTPTATSTPLPPTATATPSRPAATSTPATRVSLPSAAQDGATALLEEAQRNHQSVRAARGQMEIAMEAYQLGKPQSVTMTMDFEFADPDLHLKMSGSGLPFSGQVEAIVAGNATYLRIDNQWISLPTAAGSEQRARLNPVGVEQLQSYLDGSTGARLSGRRTVRGEECDIVAFALPPEKLGDLSALRGQTTRAAMEIEALRAEVAISTSDRLMRQMVFEIGGYEKQRPQEPFKMRIAVNMWDLNAPDIVVKAPDSAELVMPQPRTLPSPTPTTVPLPLHAYRSASTPVVDGVVSPDDGWGSAEPVRGRYADGEIQIKALHDGKDLYLLFIWDDARHMKAEGLNLYFEDGGPARLKRLDGVNDDAKYVGVSGLPDGYRDAAWAPGWSVGEQTDGQMAGRYESGKMTVEWRGPLDTGTDQDISVSADETLGFAVVNWSDGAAGSRGAWPAGASPYKPETWSTLVVRFQAGRP